MGDEPTGAMIRAIAPRKKRIGGTPDCRTWLRSFSGCPLCRLASQPAVLDAGCGTVSHNLRLLAQHLSPRYLGGFDVQPECVRRA